MLKYIMVFFVTKYKVYFWYLLKETFLLVFLWWDATLRSGFEHYINFTSADDNGEDNQIDVVDDENTKKPGVEPVRFLFSV